MKKFGISIFLTFFVLMGLAQNDAHIVGHVLDAFNREHLPFVHIQVKGTTIGCQTDETGHYFLKDLPVGQLTLVFSYMGYKTLEIPVDLPANTTKELKVELQEDAIALDNVIVTIDRYETRKKDMATIVNVVSPLVIEATGATCMMDALGFQTGLRVESTCANCGQTQLRINGLEGQYSQILMDSRPIFSSLASVYGLEQIPMGMVDYVEVVRGGTSALYGSNAIGGVVNIITKEPTKNYFNVSNTSSMVGKSAYDINTSLNATVLSDNQKAGMFLFAVQRNRKQYDHDDDGFSDIPKLNSTTAGFRSFFRTSAYSKITVDYHHVSDFRRGGNLFDLQPHETDITEQARHEIDAGGVNFMWTTPDNHHQISVYSSLQNVLRNSYYGAQKDPNAYGKSRDLTSVSGATYRWLVDKMGFMPAEFSAGVEYSYNNLKDDIMAYDRHIRQKAYTYGGYVQNEWKNELWSALVGLRVEKHNLLNKPMFLPRANLRWTPAKWVILRTGYSSGYRPPQTYEEDLHVNAVGGEVSLISNASNLKAENSHSVNLSSDLYGNWGRWYGDLLVEGFFTRLNDVFYLREDGRDAGGNLLLTRINVAGAQVAGLNIEGKIGYKPFVDLQAGYTFQKSNYLEAQTWSENPDIQPQKRIFRTPDNYAYWLLNIKPLRALTLAISGKITGSMLVQHYEGYIPEDREETTPTFCEVGLKVAYDIRLYKNYSLEVNAGVKNLFNQFQNDLDKGDLRDAAYMYGPNIPRTYFVGVNVKI